jgi:DNA topoisomerase III
VAGKTLIICEKPSVATDVARALGVPKKDASFFESDAYVIGFAVGHLVEQVDPDAYDPRLKTWRFEDLPILPDEFRYEARDAKSKKQLGILHKAIRRKDVAEVVNACDAGREGELIFKLIMQTAGVAKPVRRAWFSSMTQRAIREAFERLRDDAELRSLEDAARSRSEADWLVGMNASRAATTRLGARRNPLSLGRVQTPTLALVVNRDLEIARFVPEDYWQVRARFETAAGTAYAGTWQQGSSDRVKTAEEAERIAQAARGADGTVVSVEQKPIVEQPPLLYDLTALQRDANTRFGFTAGRTLQAAQALYDQRKVITYPRTSSRYLSRDLVPALKSIAAHVGRADAVYADGAAYVAALDVLPLGRVVNDARVTDHHAIIPTEDVHTLSRLTADERRIYDLVARRFLAVFHPEARSEATTVVTEAGGERFRSRGKVLVKPGWRAVYGATAETDSRRDGDEDESEQALPALAEGEAVACREAEVLAKQTKPPAHYSDATLLRAMETAGKLVEDDEAAEAMKESGLGTPATRAATIERLVDKEYVERAGKSLRATDRGIGLIGAVGDHVLTSPALTGQWERRLLEIERGAGDRDAFMHDIAGFTRETVEWFAGKDASAMRAHRRVIGPCPRCDGEIVERPRSYSCTSWRSKEEPGCGFQIWKQVAGRTVTPEMAADYVARGLSGDDVAHELAAQREVIGPCPTPGCGGDIVENSKAFGCTSWKSREEPGCGFVIWKKVRGQAEVTAEAAREMLASGRTNSTPAASKEPLGPCPTPGCGGQIIENSRAFGCTSWKSRKDPGCGFVIWKRQRGAAGEVTREAAAEMLRTGTLPVTAASQRAPKEPIGDCPTPGCGGQIVENSRAFGCTSWKSRKNPGCGFVIWKRQRGLDREIGREEAADLVARGLSEPAA